MEEEIKEGFVIRDDNAAEWALQKIFDEKAELERLKALADSQIAAIMDKVEAANKRFTSRTEYLKNALGEYMLTVKRKQSKTQESYRLLSGSLILKQRTFSLFQRPFHNILLPLKSIAVQFLYRNIKSACLDHSSLAFQELRVFRVHIPFPSFCPNPSKLSQA